MSISDDDKDFETLPVEDFKSEILAAIDSHQIIICLGETGSGKTTKIPQFLAETPGITRVAVTQPRRVAAVTVCERVAAERACAVGTEVGYSIRFEDRSHPESTRIKFMTDGILVRECLSDPMMSRYQAVMLDEAHERSIHTDILFALLKQACAQRKNLKLIVTSATLNAEKFSKFFNDCPIIRVPGRVYPVDIYHSKNKHIVSVSGPTSSAYISAAIDLVEKIHFEQDSGHILVFLTGQEDIEDACKEIRQRMSDVESSASSSSDKRKLARDLLVLPIYSSLPSDQQQRVFKRYPPEVRKCVIATNIAETSITVPNIRYVIDPGFVKQKAYDPSRRMETLVTVPVSKVAAQQRAGRAGRTGPGVCYRLYSSDCFDDFMGETIPEIMRSNLSNVILYLKVIGIHDVLDFDFLDRPSEDQIEDALTLLHTLKALDDDGHTTAVGQSMSKFSVEPSMARMLVESIEGQEGDCLSHVALICAMLSVEDIWWVDYGKGKDNSEHLRRKALIEHAHSELRDPLGDHLTYANIFMRYYHEGRESKSWCEDHFLKYRALKNAARIRAQLIGDALKIKSSLTTTVPDRLSTKAKKHVIQSLTAGLYMNAGRRCGNENLYRSLPLGTQSVMMYHVHPTSALFDNTTEAEYIIFVELISSSKVFIKHVSAVPREILLKFREKYQSVSAKRLSGKIESVPVILPPEIARQSINSSTKVSNATMLSTGVSVNTAVVGNVVSSVCVDLARQRYLERKRKLGSG